MSAPAQAPTAAEKADARHHIGDHAHAAVGAGQMIGEIDEGRCAHRDQHIGAQAGAALPVLPLGADQGAEHEGREQADQCVKEIIELERMQESHERASTSSFATAKPSISRPTIADNSAFTSQV